MTWFFAVLVVLAIGAVAVVAAGHGAPLAPAYADRPDAEVPAEGPLSAEDIRAVRLTTAVRGYRVDEVDALLERLAAQLDVSGPNDRTDPTDPAGPHDRPDEPARPDPADRPDAGPGQDGSVSDR